MTAYGSKSTFDKTEFDYFLARVSLYCQKAKEGFWNKKEESLTN